MGATDISRNNIFATEKVVYCFPSPQPSPARGEGGRKKTKRLVQSLDQGTDSNGAYLSFVIARRPDVAIPWELRASQQSNVALRVRGMTRLPRFARNDDVVK